MWNDFVVQRLSQQHVQELHAAAVRHRLAHLVPQGELEPARPHRPGWLHFPALHLRSGTQARWT